MSYLNHCLATRSALVFALGVQLLGCMSVKAEIPEITVTRENLAFEGLSAELVGQSSQDIPASVRERYGLPDSGTIYHFPTLTFAYDRIPVDLPSGTSCDLQIDEITIRAHEGSPNLTFIRGLRLTVANTASPSSGDLILFEYPVAGTEAQEIASSITLPSQATAQDFNPWEADSSQYKLDVWADVALMPTESWAIDIDLILSGAIEISS